MTLSFRTLADERLEHGKCLLAQRKYLVTLQIGEGLLLMQAYMLRCQMMLVHRSTRLLKTEPTFHEHDIDALRCLHMERISRKREDLLFHAKGDLLGRVEKVVCWLRAERRRKCLQSCHCLMFELL